MRDDKITEITDKRFLGNAQPLSNRFSIRQLHPFLIQNKKNCGMGQIARFQSHNLNYN